jgi:steroid delta-isomerase-like uncharacterized protein
VSASETARAYFDAHSRRDVAGLRALWADDVVIEITSQGVFRGPDECGHYFEGLYRAVPDAEMIVDRIVGDDDVAAVQWRMRGNFTGDPLPAGIDATGGWVDIRGCDVVEVSDGKVTRITAYVDGMELARSLGMMPPMDSGPERAMIAAFNVATKARRALRERLG